MQHQNYMKTKLKQFVWLLMACFCVIFSSAIKKVLQLHADQKVSKIVHRDIDGSRLLTQNIKDGSREKHEIQALVLSDNKQIPVPGFNPPSHLLVFQTGSVQLSLYRPVTSYVGDRHHEVSGANSVPLYLRSCRLQV